MFINFKGVASAGTSCRRSWARPLLLLEEMGGNVARGLFPGDVCVQPSDLLFQQRNALLQLLDREEREILTDLVRDLFLRAIVFVHCRHCSPPFQIRKNSGAWRGCHTLA